jgi:phosphoglycolate phosphatase
MIKYVLFDFDGTLVDSKDVFIKTFNHIAHKYSFKKIEAGNLDHLRNLTMIDRFRFLDVPLYKLPFLAKEFLSLYRTGLGSITLIQGMDSVLKQITDLGLGIGIVSSNSAVTIKSFVKHNGILLIADVYCSGRLFGKDRIFRKFLKDKKLTGGEVLYVCDELRDLHACSKVQIKPVWVSWGFEKQEAVQGADIPYSADTPEELFSIVEKEYLQ